MGGGRRVRKGSLNCVLKGEYNSHVVERENAKVQNYASAALWGPEVAWCFWKSDEVVVISVGKGWLISQKLRLCLENSVEVP